MRQFPAIMPRRRFLPGQTTAAGRTHWSGNATTRPLDLAVLVFRSDLAKDAELLGLRHENALLRRHAGGTWCEPAGRTWFAALA
jgi:hypothetical protein